ncbi:MAG: nucleotidyl transferase AbiEii/AbiGii toxin family protein [Saprospiraceae bacterium]|nr:nucleotidyl transferase AbiEii/AbiGii toxin family protein [Candidatus Opimibacter skivensis]MBP6679565.1 nucleotidyl transferase AbiEii/AbiGii toxin family protein [Saprospiraceae bacterium]MBP8085712.1 nucleotidyl transferase AbiEii/AbiGii toxin family protein [Saprospiraceae bacterium]
MIPQAFITEWSNQVPWQTNEQVEQDLVICRALVEIFSDPFLGEQLAFRGGTALHKLYLHPQPRYSEDIDLVQIHSGPIKPIVLRLQERLSFLGIASVNQTGINTTLKYRFTSEIPPAINLKLKIETNGREHFTILGFQKMPFLVNSSWFEGACDLTTYRLEELLGTKMRALYQRSKGRDLFDMYKALHTVPDIDVDSIMSCYKAYMEFSVGKLPSLKEYLNNLDRKMNNPEFLGDTVAILRPAEAYDPQQAYSLIKSNLLESK